MRKAQLVVSLAACLVAQAAVAAESKYVVDMSDNLYYSGLNPKTSGTFYPGTYLAPFGYPTTPMQRKDNYSVGVPFHDCPRNVRKIENGAEVEIQPDGQAVVTAEENTFVDDRTSCYGTPPVIIPVSDIPTAAGGNIAYIRVAGRIDDNTSQDLTAGSLPVDARGGLDSTNVDNALAINALVGIWAAASGTFDESVMKAYIDAAYEGGADDALNGLGKFTANELLSNPGFAAVGSEFVVVNDLTNLSPQDNDGDGIDDQGSGEFGGQLTVPAGATHLMLAYNSHKGGFYHHGDTRYIGADNPFQGTAFAQDYDEINTSAVNEPDTFTDDRVFAASNDTVSGNYAAGDTRAVGVFMVTLSDDASVANTSSSPKSVITVLNTDSTSLTVNFDGTQSLDNGLAGAMTYLWDFADGATSTEATPSHTYATAGTYQVKLTVTLSDRSNFASQAVKAGIAEPGSGSSGGGGGGGAFGLLGLLPMIGLMRRRRRS